MLVYYFTRTGRSKQIAESLAKKKKICALPISDGKSWAGIFGYVKAAVAALTGKNLPVSYENPGEEANVVVVFPVWAGKLPPAMKTFVQEVGRERIIAIPTSLGSKLNDREGFAKIVDLVGDEISAPENL